MLLPPVLILSLDTRVARHSQRCDLHALTELLVFSFHPGAEGNQDFDSVVVLFVLTY